MSRRAFYESFDTLEECFLAVLDEGARRVRELISDAFALEESWVEGVRGALAALLSFFDREPALARVLLVEATAAGSRARERREHHVAGITALIEERWGEPENGHLHPLVTAGVMASLLGVLHTQLVTGRGEPLAALLGPLVGLVTAPYLARDLVAREIERAADLARPSLAGRPLPCVHGVTDRAPLPPALRDPRAHRARSCLLYLAEHPGVSNREVADGIGIACHTQISKLLGRLERAGLLVKRQGAPGRPNAWALTQHGVQISLALRRQLPR